MVVITTEQSSNMRKSLKQKIFETVITLRTLFAKLKDKDPKKTKEISKLTKQVGEMGSELKQCTERLIEEHRAPSMAGTTELELAPSMEGTKEREEGGDQEARRDIYRTGYRTSWGVNTVRGAA